ncbi:hypothetical protein BJ166DRAFT_492169 [Pestalotiopsis sp. NC0098]|nr:hypothetical protein BJ166DRAFT_492169 [Pestalotiopsis sp. NC0098]
MSANELSTPSRGRTSHDSSQTTHSIEAGHSIFAIDPVPELSVSCTVAVRVRVYETQPLHLYHFPKNIKFADRITASKFPPCYTVEATALLRESRLETLCYLPSSRCSHVCYYADAASGETATDYGPDRRPRDEKGRRKIFNRTQGTRHVFSSESRKGVLYVTYGGHARYVLPRGHHKRSARNTVGVTRNFGPSGGLVNLETPQF